MSRRILSALLLFVGVGAGVFYARTAGPDAAQPDAIVWHRSDPGTLNQTGRPQLVEFFHPL